MRTVFAIESEPRAAKLLKHAREPKEMGPDKTAGRKLKIRDRELRMIARRAAPSPRGQKMDLY
jgi:hypothetical protein